MDKKTGLDEVLRERYCLASRRIQEICGEETVPAPFCDFFRRTAGFLVQMIELKEALETGETKGYTLEQWQEQNRALYEDILPGSMIAPLAIRITRRKSGGRIREVPWISLYRAAVPDRLYF